MKTVGRRVADIITIGAFCASMALVAGCQSLTSLTGGTDEYDGIWVGRLQFTSGENNCLRRAGVRSKVSVGDVDGDVSWYNFDQRSGIGGVVKKGGKFVGTVSKGNSRFAELEGQFSELTAEGTWKSTRCRGTWTLRKIRNAS